jgi:hypothetical protein
MNDATASAPLLPSHPVFRGASFGILTDENPLFPVDPLIARYPLTAQLNALGLHWETVKGKYGREETSFIVYDAPPSILSALGTCYGQESIILSKGGQNQLLFTNGPRTGSYHPGQGFTIADAPTDLYTTVQTEAGPVHFQLGLDFEVLRSGRVAA